MRFVIKALFAELVDTHHTSHSKLLPNDGETIAELRALYRAAEARAARLRLLSVSARELSQANAGNLDPVLQSCADRLAFFVGCREASVESADCESGIVIPAAGRDGRCIAKLVVDGLSGLDAIPDSEDREAFRMHLEMLGTAIARINAETERADLLSQLQERERTLEALLDRMFTAQEEERRKVSHELHDGVAQTATALVRLLEGAQSKDTPAASHAMGVQPHEVARSLVSELRRVIAGLRPTLLDDLGLVAALHSLAEGLEQAGFAVTRDLVGNNKRLSSAHEAALFRVAQEAITNVQKHAGGPCDVLIRARLDSDPVTLCIKDNGRGPSDQARANVELGGHNIGIDVMKERMAAIDGSLEWREGDGAGVQVLAVLPLDKSI